MSTPSDPRRRVDGSMGLLVDMAAAALDPAYGDAAVRREAEASRRPRRGAIRLGALLIGAGLILGTAAAQVRHQADRVDSQRAALVDDVRRLTEDTDQLASRAGTLRRELTGVRARALGADARGRVVAEQLGSLELVTGGVAVHGPGLIVTLDDAPDARTDTGGARGGQLGDGRVYDRDVQDVVNALWAAGAEAITVNGQRLTASTAIRSAGEAVVVDFRPLSPPYVMRAVGDVDLMEPAFADGATARRFQTWTSLYGLRFSINRAKDLRLAAAAAPDLRFVRPEGVR